MSEKKFPIFLCAVMLTGGAAAFAQTSSTPAPQTSTAETPRLTAVPDGGVPHYLRPETPEQRKLRLGTTEDPGPDPDPNKHFWRFGNSFHIEKFDRRWESYDGTAPGFVRPFAYVNAQREVYQLNDKWVWVWMNDPRPEDFVPPTPPPRYTPEQVRYFETMRSEFYDLTPKAGGTTIRFEEASSGLPNSGSWRNSLAVADMNGDGCPDIIAPPERKGIQVPAIFLGDCKGHWKLWTDVQWPTHVDYGNVAAADFNKDGHMDLVFGVHQLGVIVMLGDGKGKFTLSNQGISGNFGTRRVMVTDVDGDGYPDIVALNEGTSVGAAPQPKLRVYFNRDHGKSWEPMDIAGPDDRVGGDWLTAANLNGDAYPDFIAATIYMNSKEILFLSDGAKRWVPAAADDSLIPTLGYYYANTAGKFTSKTRDDAIVSYVRFWPGDLDPRTTPAPPSKQMIGIDRINFGGKKPVRIPIVRWSGNRPILGLAAGDFNGDGKLDLIYTRFDPREVVILLGDGKGGFTRARVEGLKLDENTNYDITVADVNGDGRPDLILMYESGGAGTTFSARDGSIQVFLNRGVTGPAPAKK